MQRLSSMILLKWLLTGLFRIMLHKEEIPDEDYLYRRIHPNHYDPDADKISSAAFKGGPETSVDWAKHTTPAKSIHKHPTHHLASIQAKIPRSKEQKVEHSPSLRNYAHSLIIGKKTTPIARYLAERSTLIVKR